MQKLRIFFLPKEVCVSSKQSSEEAFPQKLGKSVANFMPDRIRRPISFLLAVTSYKGRIVGCQQRIDD